MAVYVNTFVKVDHPQNEQRHRCKFNLLYAAKLSRIKLIKYRYEQSTKCYKTFMLKEEFWEKLVS